MISNRDILTIRDFCLVNRLRITFAGEPRTKAGNLFVVERRFCLIVEKHTKECEESMSLNKKKIHPNLIGGGRVFLTF